jgi:hypothetical protein
LALVGAAASTHPTISRLLPVNAEDSPARPAVIVIDLSAQSRISSGTLFSDKGRQELSRKSQMLSSMIFQQRITLPH